MSSSPQTYLDRIGQLLEKPAWHRPFAIRFEPPAIDGQLIRVQTVIDPTGQRPLQVLVIDRRGESHRASATRHTWRSTIAELIERFTPTAPPPPVPAGPTPNQGRPLTRQKPPKVGETLNLL